MNSWDFPTLFTQFITVSHFPAKLFTEMSPIRPFCIFQLQAAISTISNQPFYTFNQEITWKVSILFRNFPDWPESFQTVLKFSRLSGNFPDYPETFQNIWKRSKLSRNFPDYLETFQTIRKLLRVPGNFPGCLETFQTFRKLNRQSGKFLTHSTAQASFNDQFCIYEQKLSGRAKTFRSAMQTHRRGFWDSAFQIAFCSSVNQFRIGYN